ncbi:MAG TPA: glycosyltransferase family 4 protein [Phnomibacter sp.]|nr:glycosyltransferase family 4 protein [Phnomibacter sp.]
MSYVLKLCSWYPSKIDCYSGDFVQRHARAIATQIPVVAVFAVKDPERFSGGLKVEKSVEGNLTEYRVYYPQKKWLDKIWSQWYYMQALKTVLPSILREKGEPILLHVNIAWKAAIWWRYLQKKYDWPLFVTENSTEYQPAALLNIRKLGPLRQRLTRLLFQQCRMFISVSAQLVNTVESLYGKIPATVVPNAVDTSLFNPIAGPDDGLFHVLHISTLSYQKNPEGLLRVYDELLQRHQDIKLTIVGPITPLLQQWIEKWKHRSEAIHCAGLIAYDQVALMVQQTHLLTLFSRYENLPCVILEAHCAGVPVVSTNVGGIGEIIDDTNGVLVEEGNETAFLQAIERVKKGEMQFQKSKISKAAMRKYNYTQIGMDFIAAYKSAGIQL